MWFILSPQGVSMVQKKSLTIKCNSWHVAVNSPLQSVHAFVLKAQLCSYTRLKRKKITLKQLTWSFTYVFIDTLGHDRSPICAKFPHCKLVKLCKPQMWGDTLILYNNIYKHREQRHGPDLHLTLCVEFNDKSFHGITFPYIWVGFFYHSITSFS